MHSDDTNDKELKLIDEVLSKSKLESPSSNFAHRVMMNLHSMPVASSLSPKNGLLLLSGTIVALTILTFLVSGGMFDSMNETINLPQLKQSVPVNGTWVMKGLIMLNIALAFLLLDRTILRPFFKNRAS
jgi:hypothetical protein